MCGPVSAGGGMPPMKMTSTAPSKDAGQVAGASGGGATAATPDLTSLGAVLQQVVAAVQQLASVLSARGGATDAAIGGGPQQVPTQSAPGKVGGGGPETVEALPLTQANLPAI